MNIEWRTAQYSAVEYINAEMKCWLKNISDLKF